MDARVKPAHDEVARSQVPAIGVSFGNFLTKINPRALRRRNQN